MPGTTPITSDKQADHSNGEDDADMLTATSLIRRAAALLVDYEPDDASLLRSMARKYEGLPWHGPDPDEVEDDEIDPDAARVEAWQQHREQH